MSKLRRVLSWLKCWKLEIVKSSTAVECYIGVFYMGLLYSRVETKRFKSFLLYSVDLSYEKGKAASFKPEIGFRSVIHLALTKHKERSIQTPSSIEAKCSETLAMQYSLADQVSLNKNHASRLILHFQFDVPVVLLRLSGVPQTELRVGR